MSHCHFLRVFITGYEPRTQGVNTSLKKISKRKPYKMQSEKKESKEKIQQEKEPNGPLLKLNVFMMHFANSVKTDHLSQDAVLDQLHVK